MPGIGRVSKEWMITEIYSEAYEINDRQLQITSYKHV